MSDDARIEALKTAVALWESVGSWFLVATIVLGALSALVDFVPGPSEKVRRRWMAGLSFLVVLASIGQWSIDRRTDRNSDELRDEIDNRTDLRVAVANKEASESRERAAELAAKIAWRELDENDRRRIADTLRPFRSQTFHLYAAPASPEAFMFGNDLFAALSQQVGWKPVAGDASVHGPHVPSDLRDKNTLPCIGWTGVFLDTSVDLGEDKAPSAVEMETLKAAAALAGLLRELGFVGGMIGSSELPEPEGTDAPVIRIVVCPRL